MDEQTRTAVGVLRAHDVNLTQSVAGLVAAVGSLTIERGGSGPVVAGGDLSIHFGGCGPMLVAGDVSIDRGGTQSVIAAGGATFGRGAFVGAVLAPKVTVEDGGRVLLGTAQALAFGAAAGLVFALVSRVARRSEER